MADAGMRQRAIPGVDYSPSELGAGHRAGPADRLAALRLAKDGTLYDLDPGRWPGMPILPAHPDLTMTTFRTPRGTQVDGNNEVFGKGEDNVSFVTELMISSTHTGTHIDALNHITCGHDSHWYGGFNQADSLGDLGSHAAEASSMPPFVCRGVLVDIPGLKGVEALEPGVEITIDEIEAALAKQEVELRPGDAVLFRTGHMGWWGIDSEEAARRGDGAGIGRSAARWLAEAGVSLVGSDTESFEQIPSTVPDNPLPVHVDLLIEAGVHIIELLYLEDLAADGRYEFLFLCLPLRIRGATGSMVRPVAIS